MAISSTGLGSGLDIGGIVSKLVQAESQPANLRLQKREGELQAKLSAIGMFRSAVLEFKQALSSLKTPEALTLRQANSSSPEVLSATASASATPGQLSIEVLSLAKSQRLVSGAFASASSIVGQGSLTLTKANGQQVSINIDATRQSLAGIRDAINSEAKTLGISAAIVQTDAGAVLSLTSRETGTAHAVTIHAVESGAPGLAQLAYPPGGGGGMSESQAASDAVIRFDGQTVTRSRNTLEDVLPGVSLTLKNTSTTPVTLTVSEDRGALVGKLDGVASAYNKMLNALKPLMSFDPASGQAGTLLGDATLRNFLGQVRGELERAVRDGDGQLQSLSALGFGFQRDGTLSLSASRLAQALSEDSQRVIKTLAGEQGVVARMERLVDGYADSRGILGARMDSLQKGLEGVAKDRTALNARMAQLEQGLYKKFNAMDAMVGQMQLLSQRLSQQLATLPGAGNNNK